MRAPTEIDERLAALRCPCGAPAHRVHLIDPMFDGLEPAPVGVGTPPVGPRRRGSLAVPCCAQHSLGPVWVGLADLREQWEYWLDRFADEDWRGDRALLGLADPGGPV